MKKNFVRLAGLTVFLASLPITLGAMAFIKSYKDHEENIRNGARWE
jgi:hypothetical protein